MQLQPSFTVQNLRARQVEIDHLILTYLSTSLQQWWYFVHTILNSAVNWEWPSLQQIQITERMSQNDFCELLLERKLSFLRLYTQVVFAGYLTHRTGTRRNFYAFQTSLKFKSLQCTKQHFATFLLGFSVWDFKMELNSLLDLQNIKFTITEISLYVVPNTGSKNMLIPGFHWCLQSRNLPVSPECKKLQILFDPSLNYWT